MNILPKKNWHVRTSANIARVRRDEAKAAEEAKELERKSKLAEQEARTRILREKARKRLTDSDQTSVEFDHKPENNECPESVARVSEGHVNFFQHLEEGDKVHKSNEQHEEEKKKEQEEYEKKVGYLTYLGQDTEELTGEQVWWKKLPIDRTSSLISEVNKSTVSEKHKSFIDPLADIQRYLKCDGVRLTLKKHEKTLKEEETKALTFSKVKKHKSRDRSKSPSKKRKRKRSRSVSFKRSKKERKKKRKRRSSSYSSSSSENEKLIKKIRKTKKRRRSPSPSSTDSSEGESKEMRSKTNINIEKLRKERIEREKMEREKADKLVYGETTVERKEDSDPSKKKQKYNSQFNPDFARQNKLDPKQKYWLQ